MDYTQCNKNIKKILQLKKSSIETYKNTGIIQKKHRRMYLEERKTTKVSWFRF